eukprot:TRINITY_DN102228_c0_g1_i1.p1 TRINITY_DN102228_c0_g1~~TRINITY_DN102228_c0_g1_i1.p1  ORF type:complete len:2101 (+),score=434.46 TRINITY_DN102228_c0_g1_i1:520-6303(+)
MWQGAGSPCESDYALYSFVAVIYSLSEAGVPPTLTSCIVSAEGRFEPGCELTVRSNRGSLASDDEAMLTSDRPDQICGESQASVVLSTSAGDAFSQRFTVPAGLEVLGKSSIELSAPDTSSLISPPPRYMQRHVKVCYCEAASSPHWDRKCQAGDWQHAGRVALVGFERGSSAINSSNLTAAPAVLPEARCYQGMPCRLGRPGGFGLGPQDTVVTVPGSVNCSALETRVFTAPEPVDILDGSTAAATVVAPDFRESGGIATVCYCPAAANGFGCKSGQSHNFRLTLGHLRAAGLETKLAIECVPTASRCPEQLLHLQGKDAQTASVGHLFVASFKEDAPCRGLTADMVQAARLTQQPGIGESFSVDVRIPLPLLPGRYALCFCEEEAMGCPGKGGRYSASLQEVGELRILGAVQSVAVAGPLGFASIPLKVRLVAHSTGVRCCAISDGDKLQVCSDSHSANGKGAALPYPATRSMAVVLKEPRPQGAYLDGARTSLTLNVTCAALGELGRCEASGEADGLNSFACRQPKSSAVQVKLSAPPDSWASPWRQPVGSALGVEVMVQSTGYTSHVKAVISQVESLRSSTSSCFSAPAATAAHGLPCEGRACGSAIASTPGKYELCICEAAAMVSDSGDCEEDGWHRLGNLEIFGPFLLNATVQGSTGDGMVLDLSGLGLSSQDRLVSVLVSDGSDASFACRGGGHGGLPRGSTVHSPLQSSSSSLRFGILLTKGVHALCWLHANQGWPVFVGIAKVTAPTRIDGCEVGAWERKSSCSAKCGSGVELWRRQVLPGSSNLEECPSLQERRTCWERPCAADVSAWHVDPDMPASGQQVALHISGQGLTDDLRGVLVLLPERLQAGSEALSGSGSGRRLGRTEDQGACLVTSPVAALAPCHGSPSSSSSMQQVCSFATGPSQAGSYQVCLCMVASASSSSTTETCAGFLPALGLLQVVAAADGESDGSAQLTKEVLAIIIVAGAASLVCCCFCLLAFRFIRKGRRTKKINDLAAEEHETKKQEAEEEPALLRLQPEPEPGSSAQNTPRGPEDTAIAVHEPSALQTTPDNVVPGCMNDAIESPTAKNTSSSEHATPQLDESSKACEDAKGAVDEGGDEHRENIHAESQDAEATNGTISADAQEDRKTRKERRRARREDKRKAKEAQNSPHPNMPEESQSAKGSHLPPLPSRGPPKALPALSLGPRPAAAGEDLMAKAAAILEAAKQQIPQKSSGTQSEACCEAEAMLHKACESGSIPNLQDAIRHAETAGVNEAALAKARAALASLQLQEATKALLAAISGSNAEVLAAALENANSAGVETCLLERGRARLAELLEDAARSDAEAALQKACESGDLASLTAAIAHAEDAKVCKEALAKAKAVLADAEARDAAALRLQEAMATDDVEELAAALEQARSVGVQAPLLLQRAQTRLNALLEDATRREAEAALLKACEAGDVAALRLAIARAVTTNVDEQTLAKAKKALADTEAREAASLQLQRANAGLLAAMARPDVERLRAALQEARAAGSDDSLLQRGQARLMELLQDAALLALQAACESGDAHALTSAIAQAEKTQVDEDSIAKARLALAHARDREAASLLLQEAIEALLSAISAGDTDVLKTTLHKAERSGVDACLLQRGRARLMALAEETARSEAEAALHKAYQQGDVPTLIAAISHAETAKVSEEALASARMALARARDIRETAEALLAAFAGSDIGLLSRVLEEAKAVGVNEDLLRKGQDRIIDLLEEAARNETAAELREASTRPTMTPPPRTSAATIALDRATPPEQGMFPRGEVQHNLETGLRQAAIEKEALQDDEFAMLQARTSDARASKNLAHGAMPAKQVSVMTGEGHEDIAFALGSKKGQQGKNKKDGTARRDGPLPSMKGKALVDGGTLMLWKNSKAAGGSGGESKADAPSESAKQPSFAALPRR